MFQIQAGRLVFKVLWSLMCHFFAGANTRKTVADKTS